MPRQTSIQLTEATERQLDALKLQGYGTTTDIIRMAIDRMWMRESFAGDASVAATVQVWQHRTAGERYVVGMQHGQVVGAVGPINQLNQDVLVLSAHTSDWEWDPELADDITADTDAYRVVWPYESG